MSGQFEPWRIRFPAELCDVIFILELSVSCEGSFILSSFFKVSAPQRQRTFRSGMKN